MLQGKGQKIAVKSNLVLVKASEKPLFTKHKTVVPYEKNELRKWKLEKTDG